MEAKELRQLTTDDLKVRVRNWKEELFRNQFKTQGAEAKDTSIFRKLRKDIARALTILKEKGASTEMVKVSEPVMKKEAQTEAKKVEAAAEDKAPEVDDKVEKKKPAKTKAKGKKAKSSKE